MQHLQKTRGEGSRSRSRHSSYPVSHGPELATGLGVSSSFLSTFNCRLSTSRYLSRVTEGLKPFPFTLLRTLLHSPKLKLPVFMRLRTLCQKPPGVGYGNLCELCVLCGLCVNSDSLLFTRSRNADHALPACPATRHSSLATASERSRLAD